MSILHGKGGSINTWLVLNSMSPLFIYTPACQQTWLINQTIYYKKYFYFKKKERLFSSLNFKNTFMWTLSIKTTLLQFVFIVNMWKKWTNCFMPWFASIFLQLILRQALNFALDGAQGYSSDKENYFEWSLVKGTTAKTQGTTSKAHRAPHSNCCDCLELFQG